MADDESFELSGNFDDLLDEDSSSALDLETDIISDSSSVSGIDAVEPELDAPVESSVSLVDEEADDSGDKATESAVVAPSRKGILSEFTIFDAMLVFSLLLVTAAALMLAYGLNDYGTVFGLPWKTTGITVK